jgi:cellulose synthase/poly-beta-1,6-N-acetylglucosamine synthase-like glycosyltransferase
VIEPPADQPSVVVVVPTYNERPNIEALILGVLELGPRYRIVVVDDSSPDGTGVLADASPRWMPTCPTIRRCYPASWRRPARPISWSARDTFREERPRVGRSGDAS